MRVKSKYKHLKSWVHPKTGRVYTRFVRKGYPAVQLHGSIGSAEFEAAYNAAYHGTSVGPVASTIGAGARSKPGSVNSVVVLYLQSSSFLNDLATSSQKQRRPLLDRFREQYGEKPFALIHAGFIKMALGSYQGHTGRRWLKALRGLMAFAVGKGFCETDPTAGIKRPTVPKSDGVLTWEEDHIARFRSHFAIGTRERLAMELALYTGQRADDLVHMGRQHVRGSVLKIKQQKTKTLVAIPVHPDLATALAAMPASGSLTFLVNDQGRSFVSAPFSRWFGSAARQAGLLPVTVHGRPKPKGYTAHGLRKACCKRLADMGCTVTEIAAISGHLTLAEVQRYTKDYDRGKSAGTAMAKLMAGGG